MIFSSEKGFSFAAICVSVLIVGILACSLFPVYSDIAKREREKELRFILERFARAFLIFKEQNQRNPQSLEELSVKQLLRKKYANPFSAVLKKTDEIKPFEGFKPVAGSAGIEGVVSFPPDQYKEYRNWTVRAEKKQSVIYYKLIKPEKKGTE